MADAEPTVPRTVRQVEALSAHADVRGLAFQSLTVAALPLLNRVAAAERRVAEAAISLAQGEKLRHMVVTVEAVEAALRETLTPQGAMMLERHLRSADAAPERSWWFALCEALQVLEEGAAWIHAVRSGQPRGGLTHTLCSLLDTLLRAHYDVLLAEADAWMG